MKTILVLSLIFSIGCKKDEKVPEDPVGTKDFNMMNSGIRISAYTSEQRGKEIELSGHSWIAMSSSNSFFCKHCTVAKVVGKEIKGLADITEIDIPTDGFSDYMAVEVGHRSRKRYYNLQFRRYCFRYE